MFSPAGIQKNRSSSIYQNLVYQQLGIVKKNLVKSRINRIFAKSFEKCKYKEIFPSHFRSVYSLAIDIVEQRYMLSGGLDSKICLFDLEKKQLEDKNLYQIRPIFEVKREHSHEFCVSCLCWYTVDTGLFFSGGFDNFVYIWDTNNLTPIQKFEYTEKIYSMDFSVICNQHSLLAVGYGKSVVSLCDFVSGKYTHVLDTGHRDKILAVKWSPFKEHELISACASGTMILWDIRRSGFVDFFTTRRRGRDTEKFSYKIGKQFCDSGRKKDTKLPNAHDGSINSIAFCKNNNHVISTGRDSRMRLWDVCKFRLVHDQFSGITNNHAKGIGICVSNDGNLVVHPNQDRIGIYNIHNGETVNNVKTFHFDDINCCVYHPSKQEIYSCSNDNQICIYSPSMVNKNEEKKMNGKSLIY